VPPPTPTSLLVLALLQGSPAPRPPSGAACEDLQRVELALAPATTAREICVSPGLVTSFVFDVRADVELQDEVRFLEVTRGRSTISFLPPRDMMPGERLRLMARLGTGGPQEELVPFTLVARSGQATHQVEVYRDQRSRESYQQEVTQERAKVQQLREQLEKLQNRLDQSGGLRELILTKALTYNGIQGQRLGPKPSGPLEGLSFQRGSSYRTNMSVAVEAWLVNPRSESWTVVDASLVDATGRELKPVKLSHERTTEAEELVVVEFDATMQAVQGEYTLLLRDDAGHVLHIPQVTFPP